MALPAHIKPMLATAGVLPPDQARYAFEMKWDGIRAVSYWNGKKLTLESRNLRDISASWPELHALGGALGDTKVILDGEIVSLDDRGVPSFQRLQERMHVVAPSNDLVSKVPAAYFIFDVLHLDGRNLMPRPWTERRELLESLALAGGCWATPPSIVGEGDVMIAASKQRELEGVVAKRIDIPYTPGQRSKQWIKLKNIARNEFVVCGWTAGEGRRAGSIGSLALGLPVRGGYEYVGNVGTGFTDKELRRLESVLGPTRTDENPYVTNVEYLKKGTVFVEPRLVVDVEYTERTNEGILRHPSYKGERIDKAPADVNTDQTP